MKRLPYISELFFCEKMQCIGKCNVLGKSSMLVKQQQTMNMDFPVLFTSEKQLEPKQQSRVALTWFQCYSTACKSRIPLQNFLSLFRDLTTAYLPTALLLTVSRNQSEVNYPSIQPKKACSAGFLKALGGKRST